MLILHVDVVIDLGADEACELLSPLGDGLHHERLAVNSIIGHPNII